jgi:hypothetical protein
MIVMNLVTLEAAAKLDLLFNKLASVCFLKSSSLAAALDVT